MRSASLRLYLNITGVLHGTRKYLPGWLMLRQDRAMTPAQHISDLPGGKYQIPGQTDPQVMPADTPFCPTIRYVRDRVSG